MSRLLFESRGGKSSSHPSQKGAQQALLFFCTLTPALSRPLPPSLIGRGRISAPVPSGASCPPKPHPRSLSTSWRGRAQRSAFFEFGTVARIYFPLSTKWRGGEASEGRTLRGLWGEDAPYPPSTAFLKSCPGPGSGPIQVPRMASAVALPCRVPLLLPLTSTVVPVPGT